MTAKSTQDDIIGIAKDAYITGANDTLDTVKETLPIGLEAMLNKATADEASALDSLSQLEAFRAGLRTEVLGISKLIDEMRQQDLTGAN